MKELAPGGGIDPDRMPDASLSERSLDGMCACLRVKCMADGLGAWGPIW